MHSLCRLRRRGGHGRGRGLCRRGCCYRRRRRDFASVVAPSTLNRLLFGSSSICFHSLERGGTSM